MSGYVYDQASGRFAGPDGEVLADGYSGHGAGVNNPAMEAVAGVGRIPRGQWLIGLRPLVRSSVGPLALALTPVGHDAHGRTLFRIHGDTRAMNRTASHGCVILPREVRQHIIAAGVTTLTVA